MPWGCPSLHVTYRHHHHELLIMQWFLDRRVGPKWRDLIQLRPGREEAPCRALGGGLLSWHGRANLSFGQVVTRPLTAIFGTGTPAARPVRKATGLPETARLPKKASLGRGSPARHVFFQGEPG
jgi:hypothetical protein